MFQVWVVLCTIIVNTHRQMSVETPVSFSLEYVPGTGLRSDTDAFNLHSMSRQLFPLMLAILVDMDAPDLLLMCL